MSLPVPLAAIQWHRNKTNPSFRQSIGGFLKSIRRVGFNKPTERKAAMTITLKPVKSSQIASIGHDPKTNTLAIQFSGSKKLYHYEGFSSEEFAKFEKAESVGKHFSSHIRGKFLHSIPDEKKKD
jgi:hypothetical protein